jgi:hypothetical protein
VEPLTVFKAQSHKLVNPANLKCKLTTTAHQDMKLAENNMWVDVSENNYSATEYVHPSAKPTKPQVLDREKKTF